eukprot:TRINITY_DN6498_c0_g6_i1.p1 TRINITY_DN6498_c0_g6~~TRINITY_DN6498_c0_g6_i1.p1  ORF type:complete len:181 (+),score=28.72 TRINITY_DN6498_c0_g6_i1:335-877(+)
MEWYLKANDKKLSGKKEIDYLTMWMWIFAFQFFGGLPFVLVIEPLSPQHISVPDIPEHLRKGLKCFLEFDNSGYPDDCKLGVVWLLVSLAAGLVLSLLVTKIIHGESAALSSLVGAVAIPLSNIVCTFKFLMGDGAITLHWFDYVSLVCVVAGLFVYRIQKEKTVKLKDLRELDEIHLNY